MEKVNRGEGGFTLLEVLIVIILLGILAAVVVFNVGGFLGQGTEQIAKMQGNLLQTSITAAMAQESATSVTAGHIGNVGNGASITNPGEWNLTVGDTEVPMSKYIQNDITGYWEWNDSGTIINGTYTGGKTCTYDNGNWTCQ
jgi:general secretion pathway protein G